MPSRIAAARPFVRRLLSTTSSAAASPSAYANISTSLPKRQLPLLYDYLTPTPSYLLSTTLAPFLPSHHVPATLPSATHALALPASHHLVYFPPPTPLPSLLPDGTDPQLWPGDPFTRRMWAGGHIYFPSPPPLLDSTRVVCAERITDVKVRGPPGGEKVYVGVERRIADVLENEAEEEVKERVWNVEERDQYHDLQDLWGENGGVKIVERREFVFIKQKSLDDVDADKDKTRTRKHHKIDKILKAPHEPSFAHSLTPSPALLFRYSALTFNAHLIHLSRTFCQSEEGHPNLLVHGPLSLTLLLSTLTSHLTHLHPTPSTRPVIREVSYRNIAPLYCGEKMRICGRKSESGWEVGRKAREMKWRGKENVWEMWIENRDGSVCVRGRVRVGEPGREEAWGWGFWDEEEVVGEGVACVGETDAGGAPKME